MKKVFSNRVVWGFFLLAPFLFGEAFSAGEIPAGTAIVVRTAERIDIPKVRNGEKFDAVVDDEVLVDGRVVVHEGEKAVLVLVRGSGKNPKEVGIRLDSVEVGGRKYSAKSQFAEVATEKQRAGTGKTTAIASGVGAVVGAVVGGGKGALIGAGAGAGAGLLISAIDGSREIPAETRLSLALRESLRIK